MRHARVVFCALVVVLGGMLGACGGDAEPAKPIRTVEPQNTASSPSADPMDAKGSPGCKLLTAKERQSVAGEKLETVVPVPVIDGVLLCQWVESLSSAATTSIRVISQRVQRWTETLPAEIDRIIASGKANEKLTDQLQVAKRTILRGSDEISDAQACKYFSLLLEVNDRKKKGRTEALLYQGTSRGDFTVAWYRCAGGVHTEITYAEPGVQVSLPLAQSVVRLGKVAHQRAVKIL
jgi:hypothetical protein